MIEKNYQALANQYYRLTGETYRKLDPNGSDFMNLGLWPAPSIASAQRNIYSAIAELTRSIISDNSVEFIIELGCGWGGGVEVLLETFKKSAYLGINSSEAQIQFCKAKYSETGGVEFQQEFYESAKVNPGKNISLVVGVESLLHCGNRLAVFEMIRRSKFDYISLAEILLADDKARSHKLFNPALSYAANFNDYQKLFEAHGYDLVIEKDLSKQIFKPWALALEQLAPDMSGIHKKIKNQFIESYSLLSKLSEEGQAKYVFLIAKRRDKLD